jgi:Ni/Fe-hydrogenase subunit HybB-like protein
MSTDAAGLPARPVGGTLLTRPYGFVLALAALGLGLIAWRFAVGLGASTALSDGYPWGLWIAFDVVTGTALACGGYAVAIVAYVLNRGRYHPLVRPAVLTSALGYSIAGFSILIDVGRPWLVWKVPLFFWQWNLNSALLEIALCVMAYVFVLWIELSPALLERWREDGPQRLRAFAARALPVLDRGLVWILALGILLPTMHQSSLGTLILLSGPKLHPLWNTPILPLLFLLTAFAMGYAAVVMESALAAAAFRRPAETGLLVPLERAAAWTAVAFVALRLADLAWRGSLGAALVPGVPAAFFWLENALFLLPLVALRGGRRDADAGRLWRGALFLILAGGLFRFDAYLLAYDPGPGWHYFPSVAELMVTVGLVALEVAVYIALVKKLPILGGARPVAASAS